MSKEFPDLKIHDREGDPSYILIFFIIVNRFQLQEVFYDLLDFGCPLFILGAFGTHMSRLSAAEAESFLHTLLVFFGRKFPDFDDVYIHGVGVTGFGRSGERMV